MKILKRIGKIIFFILMVIYEEIIFSSVVFKQFPSTIVLIILFSIPIGILFDILTSCLKEKANKIISYIIIITFSIVFCAHFVYNQIYHSLISIYSFFNGKQVFQFYDTILEVIKNNFYVIVLFLLPLIVFIILHKLNKIDFSKTSLKEKVIKLTMFVLIQIMAVLSVNIRNGEGIYQNKSIYYNSNSLLIIAKKFGVCTSIRLDIKRSIFKDNDNESIEVINKIAEQPKQELDEMTEYNILKIDFSALAENENNPTIKSIHKYMESQIPSEKNEYTGMFEGKNLIVIVAESFSNIGIREDFTPTLYKLSKEGFEFENFYTPLYPVSTGDGEYMADTSLIPKEGIWSIAEIRNNYMPYSYANVFKRIEYTTNAYHDHTATYYERDKYMPAMGYDSFLAVGSGLEQRMNCNQWPNSDLEMVKVTTDDYIDNDKFLAYYMTVSGHLNYYRGGNAIVDKNWDMVKDLPYTDEAKGYLATQIELDRAVEQLIHSLEEEGKLEDTVIVITGDHYPYGLEMSHINELSTYTRDDVFEKCNMPLIIWNSEIEEPIEVEKIGSIIDVLPTVLNLFGVEYDSRLLMGRDILSNSEPLVIFSDGSFITDKGRYNALTDEFTSIDEEIDQDYIERIGTIVEGKKQVSRLILEKDYYNFLINYL